MKPTISSHSNIPLIHKSLPSTPNADVIFAHPSRTVLPIVPRKLELFQNKLYKSLVVAGGPRIIRLRRAHPFNRRKRRIRIKTLRGLLLSEFLLPTMRRRWRRLRDRRGVERIKV
jgi:hypothetical protein